MLLLLSPPAILASVDVANLAVDASLGFEIHGSLVAVRSSEARSANSDLNGDGDTSDFVLQIVDAETGRVTNTALEAAGGVRMSGNLVAFTVSEARQGMTDLNGDGDASDFVLHLYDAMTRATTNLGFAAGSFELHDGALAFTIPEASQHGTDLNGDGDAKDAVLHVYDARNRTVTNLGKDASGGLILDRGRVAFGVSERNQRATDLNGDGDTGDVVLYFFDFASGASANLAKAIVPFEFQLDSDVVAFLVRESAEGNADLNGDGDASDNVLHLIDAKRGSMVALGLAARQFQLDGSRVAFTVAESEQASSDLNGDGDGSDEVLHLFESGEANAVNLGYAVHGFQLEGDHLAFGVPEQGQHASDLNADGDTLDIVLHLFDAIGATTANLGTDASLGFELEGGMLLAFGVSESGQGDGDLNGDGDASDFVLHLFDIQSGTILNLAVDPSGGFQSFQLDGKHVSFGVQELAQGAADLNGDGDFDDVVLHFFDAATGFTANLALDVTLGHQIDQGFLAFAVTEARQGMTDLNGDGDAGDVILHVARIARSPRERIEALIEHVRSLDLLSGIETSLTMQLEHALRDLDAGDACHASERLRVFQRMVRAQSGREIPGADADALAEEAGAIIDALALAGC